MLDVSCDPNSVDCCTVLSDIAAHLLDATHGALLECYRDPCLAPTPYMTMGNGDDAVRDSLTVSFSTAEMTPGSLAAGAPVRLPMVTARFSVRLHESGWPTATITGDTINPPDPAAQNRAAVQSFAHGEKMYRKLLHMQSTRQLVPATVKGCGPGAVGPLTPVPPRGGVVGWVTTVTIPVPWGGG